MRGKSGSVCERCAVVTASARNVFLRSGPIEADIGSNIMSALPAIMSRSAGPPPS